MEGNSTSLEELSQSELILLVQNLRKETEKLEDENTKLREESYDLLYKNVFLIEDNADLKMVADSAHDTAQFTMDANRRQVIHITELRAKITEANKILDEIALDHELYKLWSVMFKELREVLK